MSETPRTDKMFDIWTVSPDALEFTRALEKEINHLQKYTDDIRKKLTAAEAQVAELQHDITRQMAIATEHVNRAEAAEALVAELRKDAERYRWLRTDRHILMGMAFYSNEELDATIDAAKESGKC